MLATLKFKVGQQNTQGRLSSRALVLQACKLLSSVLGSLFRQAGYIEKRRDYLELKQCTGNPRAREWW